MKITYWSDYACPYCYIGEARLKKAIAEIPELKDIETEMKAFQLDPTAGEHATGDTQTRFAHKYRKKIVFSILMIGQNMVLSLIQAHREKNFLRLSGKMIGGLRRFCSRTDILTIPERRIS